MTKITKRYLHTLRKDIFQNRMFYLMLLPGIAYFILFCYAPMYGVTIAFKKYSIFKGYAASPWVGFDIFRKLFSDASFQRALRNNIIISLEKLIFGFPTPIILSLLINEIHTRKGKKLVQTAVILPNFISWIIIQGMLFALFNTTSGAVPGLLRNLGYSGTIRNLLMDKKSFRGVIIFSYLWRSGGYASIVYLAAIAGIDQQLYEAADMDGAGRFQKMWHVTLGSLRPTIIMLFIIRLGDLMYAGFDQIYAISNYAVIEVAEVIDTYVYKIGLESRKFSEATAAGLFQSAIGLILVLTTNYISKRVDPESGLL